MVYVGPYAPTDVTRIDIVMSASVGSNEPRAAPARTGTIARRRVPPADALAVVVVLLGGLLRLYHVTALSLWVDEGITVMFSHLSWPVVLGLHGGYDAHPPLYYALVKLVARVAPDTIAGRLVSVVAGTATLAVLYLLVSRLAGKWVALAAALVLAVSPSHIWYSQEARQYALNVLLVLLSYLALVAYAQLGRRAWAVLYGASLVLAMYVEYSALFALAPQALLILATFKRQRRRALVLLGAAIVAALLFAPWLPSLAVQAGPQSSQGQFALSPAKVFDALVSFSGVAANAVAFAGPTVPPWNMWPALQGLLLLGLVPAIVAGVFVLARGYPRGLLVAACLAVGTIVVALGVSLRYPSFAERTVLYAVPGWAIIAGAALAGRPSSQLASRALRLIGRVSAAYIVVVSLVTVNALYADAQKQDWRGLAADTATAARTGWPVITIPSVTSALIDAYQPYARAGRHIAIGDGGSLSPALVGTTPVLFAYVAGSGDAGVADVLARRGYARVMHSYYPFPLYLDLYARPGMRLGRDIPINGDFTGAGPRVPGWTLPPAGVALDPTTVGSRALTLTNAALAESIAATSVPARSGRLYTLSFEARSRLRAGGVRSFLICLSTAGAFNLIAPDGGGATIPNDGAWHTVRIAALCPAGTTHMRIDLRNSGQGTVSFRTVSLQEAALTPTPR